jgi:uncharacterized protein
MINANDQELERDGMEHSSIAIAERCKAILKEHYGPNLIGVVFYGSRARREQDDESDLDLLVLLREPFNTLEEVWKIATLLYPLQSEIDYVISAIPVPEADYDSGAIQLYRNARAEGIVV